MRFEAEIRKGDEVFPAVGVDIHEDGARILCREQCEPGAILFLFLNEVQLGGFVEVRHCSPRKDGRYAMGVAFRGHLLPQGSTWQIQRAPTTESNWTHKDDHIPGEPRQVA